MVLTHGVIRRKDVKARLNPEASHRDAILDSAISPREQVVQL